jgi:hypothetical protein
MFFQPFLGLMHHIGFRRKGRRGFMSWIHVWLGRFLITLGMINGGLGLLLANNANYGEVVAYGVVAGVIWLVMMALGLLGDLRALTRRSNNPPGAVGGGRRFGRFGGGGGRSGPTGPIGPPYNATMSTAPGTGPPPPTMGPMAPRGGLSPVAEHGDTGLGIAPRDTKEERYA